MPGLDGASTAPLTSAPPAAITVNVARPLVTARNVGSSVTWAAKRASRPTISGGYSMNSSVRSAQVVTDWPGSSAAAAAAPCP
jgi:hypothetical protein